MRSLIATYSRSSELLLKNSIDKQQDAEEGSNISRPWSIGTVDNRARRVVSETGQKPCRARPVEANVPTIEDRVLNRVMNDVPDGLFVAKER